MVRHSSLTVSANSRHMALSLTSAFWEILMFQQLRNSPLRDLPYPWHRPPSAAAAPAGTPLRTLKKLIKVFSAVDVVKWSVLQQALQAWWRVLLIAPRVGYGNAEFGRWGN